MCRIFAESDILGRSYRGEFSIEQVDKPKEYPWTDHKGKFLVGNRVLYIRDLRFTPDDDRYEVARVHMHITERGEIGASGLPEPKEMVLGEINYRGIKKKNPFCELCEGGDMITPEKRFYDSFYKPGNPEVQ